MPAIRAVNRAAIVRLRETHRRNLTIAALFAALFLLFLAGCTKTDRGGPTTIIVSGDTAGWIVPCGCTSNQSGGLPRRATLIEERRQKGPVVVVDVGGAPSGDTLYDKLKFEAILQGEAAMDVAAHNIGQAEAALGIDELRNLHEKWNTPWVSANTTDAAGNPFTEPMREIVTEGRKIMFIGVLSQKYATETIRVTPPKQAVLKALQKAGKYDHAVVLAYVPEDELRKLTESLPEVDAVVGGPTGQPVPPDFQGRVLTTSATKQGKFLASLVLSQGSNIRAEIIDLDERFADDPVQLENVRKFHADLKRRDLSPKETPFVERYANPSERIAGTKTCYTCHEDEYRIWNSSQHANAWASLVKREAEYDPDCQRCHVTGYGRLGGFETVALSGERFNVGCESCHGGSAEHCGQTSVLTPFAKRAQDRCVRCHDKENSPDFDFDTYWTKIKH